MNIECPGCGYIDFYYDEDKKQFVKGNLGNFIVIPNPKHRIRFNKNLYSCPKCNKLFTKDV